MNTSNLSLTTAGLATIVSSLCCLGPLLLVMLGIGGAWVSSLTLLEPYRPVFIVVVFVFLGLAFRSLYLLPQQCEIDKPCANPVVLRKQRIVFWLVSIVLLGLLALPAIIPFFL